MQTTQQASRYVFPALGALYERCQRFAYPILRVTFGVWFIPHGCQKLFGWWGGNIAGVAKGMAAAGIEPGMFWAYYIGVLELVGGFLIAIGFLTRPVAALFFGSCSSPRFISTGSWAISGPAAAWRCPCSS